MLLSVVIPTQNRAAGLKRSLIEYYSKIYQALDRKDDDFEFLIIDDHSTDNTKEIIQSFAKIRSNIYYFNNEFQPAPGMARNIGLQNASGNWIWFLDDDDRLFDEYLATVIQKIKNKHDETEVIAHSLKSDYKGSHQLIKKRLTYKVTTYREHQEVFRFILKRDLLLNNKITFSSGFHEDIRFITQCLLLAKRIEVIPYQIIQKISHPYSITSNINAERINGYIQAFNELKKIIFDLNAVSYVDPLEIFDQTLGVILYLLSKETDDRITSNLLKHLASKSHANDAWSHYIKSGHVYGVKETNFKYSGYLWRSFSGHDFLSFISQLKTVFSTRLSCKDLDCSLFLGPGEIRACCKRFFYKGFKKGDVVLLPATSDITIEDINNAKNKLIKSLNDDSSEECRGCPYIERRASSDQRIDYISLENFAFCNLRCTYCSPKYYDGAEAIYNTKSILSLLFKTPEQLSSNVHVVWGGGEPTLSPQFNDITELLKEVPAIKKIRILSNSTKLSKSLMLNLSDPRFTLVTSVDAGTNVNFKVIRGKDLLTQVLENLSCYKKQTLHPSQIIIKYIVGKDNCASDEIENFVSLLKNYDLLSCVTQISCDFRIPIIDKTLACAIYELAGLLFANNVYFAFFDDLIRDRLQIDGHLYGEIHHYLKKKGLDHSFLFTPDSFNDLIIFGSGKQCQWIQSNTQSGRSGKIKAVIESLDQISCTFSEYKCNIKIFPAGVQVLPELLQLIEQRSLKKYLFRGVIL